MEVSIILGTYRANCPVDPEAVVLRPSLILPAPLRPPYILIVLMPQEAIFGSRLHRYS